MAFNGKQNKYNCDSRHTESCSQTHLYPAFDLLVVSLLLQEAVQLPGELLLSKDFPTLLLGLHITPNTKLHVLGMEKWN